MKKIWRKKEDEISAKDASKDVKSPQKTSKEVKTPSR